MIWLIDAVLAGGLALAVALDELRRWRRRRALRRARLLEALTEEWPASDWLEDVTGSCEITMGPGVAIPVNGDPRDLLGWVDVDGARCVCVHPDGLTFDKAPTWRRYPAGGEWLADPGEVR